ncbi:hypothetical protein L615_000200000750 [Nocardioides sp. J9]|uniref:hypothetical protein n=1 Tax=Nocardioides sp. J9 TaxID=935844 RepID=UPI00119D8AC0|nr:hypothetical protein [Nocardioides sp. J9]TWH00865.1 hypothetical protein L615_000200000750 [Nocardioides sp. J9]
MVEQLVHASVLVVVAILVGAVGYWGRSQAVTLVPAHLEVFDRERRVRTLRRGATACYLAAAVLVGAAVLAVL